jgi:hypothetical protein
MRQAFIMAGLAPALHCGRCKDVNARHKAGHDEISNAMRVV